MAARFRDRTEAGQRLAAELRAYADDPEVRVLALPRGGVPVAYEVARALHAPLDVFLVRKLGLPRHPELAMGAIATGGVMVIDEEMVRRAGVTGPELRAVADAEQRELARREQRYRGDRPPPEIAGRTVILVDDGLATGSTMRAAVSAVRREGAKRVVVAVPIAPPETCDALRAEADDAVCAITPEPFVAVGMWYEDFSQTTDAEVQELLDDARASASGTPRRIPLPMDPLDATAEWGRP